MVTLPEWTINPEPEPEAPAPFTPTGDTSLDFAAEILTWVSADCGYGEWRDVVFGIADKFGEGGRELARSWSASAPNRFQERAFETLWRSAFRPWSGKPVTWGTIEKMAEEAGAKPREVWARHHCHDDRDTEAGAEIAANILKSGEAKNGQEKSGQPFNALLDAPKVEPFPITWFADIEADPVKDWLIQDWIGVGELFVPYGAPGSGKSVIVGDMCCHIGAGWRWFGKRVRQCAVLYVAAERARLVLRRFAAFRKRHEIDDLPVAVISGYFDMAKARKDTDRIIATVAELKRVSGLDDAVVIIDTKRQVIGDENSDDISALTRNIAHLRASTDASVGVVDHTPFHSPTKPAGRGELLAVADITALVKRVGEVRTMEVVKASDGIEGLRASFSLESVELGTHPETGDTTTAPVVVAADEPEPGKGKAGHLTTSEKIALEALEEAVVDAGERVTNAHIPDDALTVHVELWRDYAYARGISDSDTPAARRQAFHRAKKELLVKDRAATWSDHAWVVKPSGQTAADLILKGGVTRDKA